MHLSVISALALLPFLVSAHPPNASSPSAPLSRRQPAPSSTSTTNPSSTSTGGSPSATPPPSNTIPLTVNYYRLIDRNALEDKVKNSPELKDRKPLEKDLPVELKEDEVEKKTKDEKNNSQALYVGIRYNTPDKKPPVIEGGNPDKPENPGEGVDFDPKTGEVTRWLIIGEDPTSMTYARKSDPGRPKTWIQKAEINHQSDLGIIAKKQETIHFAADKIDKELMGALEGVLPAGEAARGSQKVMMTPKGTNIGELFDKTFPEALKKFKEKHPEGAGSANVASSDGNPNANEKPA